MKLLLLSMALMSAPQLRTITSLELVKDWPAAIEMAAQAVADDPESQELAAAHVRLLARGGRVQEACSFYQSYSGCFGSSPELAEALAWGVIEEGSRSTPLLNQLAGLVGAVMTQGVPAVDLLLSSLQSPNSLLRAVAAEMAGYMGDEEIRDRLKEMARQERVPEVRVAVVESLGRLHAIESRPLLERLIAAPTTPIEERLAAIGAVVGMTEQMEEGELLRLLRHPRAGMRQLGCQLVAQLDKADRSDLLLPLLRDTRADVRMAALSALGQLRCAGIASHLQMAVDDPDPMVSITASWLLTLHNPEEGMHRLARWLVSDHPEWARRAAAAVAKTGKYGVSLARQWMEVHPDPYVRANLAIGMIGQRVETQKAGDLLFALFEKEKGRWMWESELNPLFPALVPSQVRYKGTIPNYPEAVNQTTRLELVSLLAAIGHPKADTVMRDLLRERQWGITGLASVTLLEEGDELAIDLVRQLLEDEDHRVRIQAALALAIWGRDPSAVGVLTSAYKEADRDTKLMILEGIGRVGSAESLPFLIEQMGEPFEVLRLFSASAVIQSINQSGGES